MSKYLFTIILSIFCYIGFAQEQDLKKQGINTIQINSVKAQLDFLASDWMEGRETGEKGMFISADYIASIFAMYGVEPFGDVETIYPTREERKNGKRPQKIRSYFQDFSLIHYKSGSNSDFKIISKSGDNQESTIFNLKTDFYISGGSTGASYNGDLVFVGYGISDPGNSYDDFKGIDVKGKIIVRIQGFPGHKDTSSIAYKKFSGKKNKGNYPSYYLKNEAAKKNGAAGIIQLSYGESPWQTNFPLRFQDKDYEGDVPMPRSTGRMEILGDSLKDGLMEIYLTQRAWNHLLDNSGIDVAAFEKQAADKMKPASIQIKNKSVSVKYDVDSKLMKARNVLAWIPGKDTNSFVVCGAHYDHLGKYNGVVWNGADDNASGTVGVMEMAKAFITTGQKPEYSIVFAAWTGEEKGLLGSNYYVDNALKLKQKIQLNFNFDMISRDSPSDTAGLEIGISYMTGRKDLKEMVMNNNEKYQFRLKISLRESDGKRGGSDYVPFGTKGIAFLGHYAGWHDDYHMPGDETSKTNYKKLTQIIRLSFANLWDVSTIVKKQE